jgi:hypothetical protein
MGFWKNLLGKRKADFSEMTTKDLNRFIDEHVNMVDSVRWDYVNPSHGNSINLSQEVNQNPLIHKVSGFHPDGLKSLKVGDVLIMKTSVGDTAFLILDLTRDKEPEDVFHAYIAGVDTEPNRPE